MKEEIQKQVERINVQIAAETNVYNAWKKYADCDIKTAVINQSLGVIRGLETARESLQYVLATTENNQMQMEFSQ